MKYTSASANKAIRSLNDEKELIRNQEQASCTYILSVGEDTEPPEYDFRETRERIAAIDAKVAKLRHALHAFNLGTVLPNVGMSIDEALIVMAQLSEEKRRLSSMRTRLPKIRVESTSYSSKSTSVAEYKYANYSIAEAEKAYQEVSKRIEDIQLDLDLVNQTEIFEVDV